MAMAQVRAQVKAPAPERVKAHQVLERVKAQVLEREPERAQAWVLASAMERNPVLALETDQVLGQLPETDRVMDQELGWESAEPRCHRRCCRL